MANPTFYSHVNRHCDQKIPVVFSKKHLEGTKEHKEAKLRSNAWDRTWEVKMDGLRFAGGWEEFVVAHALRDDDMLLFRHEGDMVFHVTAYGPNRCEIQYDISRCDDDNNDKDNIENLSSKRKAKKTNPQPESECDKDHSCFEARVTASSLREDKLIVPEDFASSNGMTNNRRRLIVLMNERGKPQTLNMRYRKRSGKVYIKRGWKSFCCSNGLQAGDFCTFKRVENRTKLVLRLSPTESIDCSSGTEESSGSEASKEMSHSTDTSIEDKKSSGECSKRKGKKTPTRWKSSSSPAENRFLTLTPTPNCYRTGQLFFSTPFMRANGIEKPCDITLLDKDGKKWPSELLMVKARGAFYVRKGWKDFCEANGVKEGESFTSELLWSNKTPVLAFRSKVEDSSPSDRSPDVNL